MEQIEPGLGEEPPPPPPKPPKRDSSEAPLVSLAQAVVRHRSRESGVATELIATQAELTALVGAVRRGEDDSRVRALRGWRRELVGQELRELIEGRRQVSVGDDGALHVTPVDDGRSLGQAAGPPQREARREQQEHRAAGGEPGRDLALLLLGADLRAELLVDRVELVVTWARNAWPPDTSAIRLSASGSGGHRDQLAVGPLDHRALGAQRDGEDGHPR